MSKNKISLSRVELAVARFKEGYTCSQSIFITYSDLFGISSEQAVRLASSFGGGLGGMHQVCGTVTGMSMLAGLYNGMTRPGDTAAKKANYDLVKQLAGEFTAEHGSIRCDQLLGLEAGASGQFKKKPCAEYVRTCAALVEKHLLESDTL